MSPASSSHNLLQRSDVGAVLALLNRDGEEARIVGGAVRDSLMGRPVSDIDIATTTLPDTVMQLARAQGWKVVPTGIAHGTVTLVIEGIPIEVTTLRRDVETDGRHAVVAFSRDFREDAFRRDFTINALSLSSDGILHDYATGVADAKAGRLRFMGDAGLRIREDYLRILRFFRFHASRGRGAPEPEALQACADLKEGMAGLSRERIRQELLKLLVAERAIDAVALMQSIALWPVIVPGVTLDLSRFGNLAAIEQRLGKAPDAIVRLAALSADADWQKLLKLSNHEQVRLDGMRRFVPEFGTEVASDGLIRSLIFRASGAGFQDALMLAGASGGHEADWIESHLEKARPYLAEPSLNPFSSADILALGIPPGPRMGEILKQATLLWLEAGLPDDTQQQKLLLAEAVRTTQG